MWISEVAFRAPENAHNGYGADRVETISHQDLDSFLQDFYAPANALLTVSGSFDRAYVVEQIYEAFAGIDKPLASAGPVLTAEPDLTEDRLLRRHDPHAPHPATAIAFRAPSATGLTRELLATTMLADNLVDDPLGRLDRRLGPSTGVTDLGSYVGLFANPFGGRAPLPWIVEALHSSTLTADQLVAEIRDELTAIAQAGPTQDEVNHTARRTAAQMWRAQDQTLGRLLLLGAVELLHGTCETALNLPAQILTITPDEVRAAASFLAQQHVAVLTLEEKQ
ncbi:pitrilysin family protein [Streptomyces sp. NBRC 110028]|uniref:M16 family metallopeptidase n=1 Tax=Streptomyces sp. NBRC 110028 TaxID=1621260 RepID=UPI0006E2D98D|nr:insulinase family protein [Streptomyces sp. NBRC 110028]